MKILIIIGNPNVKKSFCHRLADVAKEVFEKNDHEVRMSDLYLENFQACGGMKDFTKIKNDKYFDYQMEQKHAVVKENFETFSPEVLKHINDVKWCDFLLFVFPLYWYNVPGVIKCWIDRILAHCFAYGHGGRATLSPRKVSYLTTAGSPSLERGGMNSIDQIRQVYYFGFELGLTRVGLKWCDPFFVLGSTFYKMEKNEETGRYTLLQKPTQEQRDQWVEDFKKHVSEKYL